MSDIFTKFAGEWAVVDCTAQKYIGRINNYKAVFLSEYSKPIKLQPVFEFGSNIVQQRDGSFGRNVVVLPLDLTADLNTELIIVNYNTLLLFNTMQTSDQNVYKGFVEKAATILESVKAERAGITLATTMPKSNILLK